MATDSTRLRTAKAFIAHFAMLDSALLASLLAEDYTHVMAPSSLGVPRPLTRGGFLAHNADLRRVLAGFPVTAREYLESEGANAVVVWATSRAVFREDVKALGAGEEASWEFEGEYVFMLHMDETGERVARMVEFLDSKKTEEIRPLIRRARELLEARDGKGEEAGRDERGVL